MFRVEVLALLISLLPQGARGRQCWQGPRSAARGVRVLPGRARARGGAQGCACIHRLSGRAGQGAEHLYVQADSTHKKNKTGTEVFFLSFKCQSGMVWDSAGARPSRVRGAQVLGLSRLKKGLVTCHSSEIWRAAQPVRRLSKLHFDRETPACWMTTYFLMLSHNKSAPEHWKV